MIRCRRSWDSNVAHRCLPRSVFQQPARRFVVVQGEGKDANEAFLGPWPDGQSAAAERPCNDAPEQAKTAGHESVKETTQWRARGILLGAGAIGTLAIAWVAAHEAGMLVPWPSRPSETPSIATPEKPLMESARSDPALSVEPGSGQAFRDQLANGEPCAMCPEMVVVPAGEFIMGSPENEPERDPVAESPQHRVKIAKPFAVGRFAVTFSEWDACVADGGCGGYQPRDQGWGRGMLPVINVTWDQAKSYVSWLSNKTGKPYRLLSEAEREYVTRAGTTSAFWFGNSISTDLANYRGTLSYGGSEKGVYRKRTVPVDSFKPNPWGLFQVHGNVYELVEDCSNPNYVGAPADGSAWTTGICDSHVIRGGSWVNHPKYLKSAHRSAPFRNDSNVIGFRVARTIN